MTSRRQMLKSSLALAAGAIGLGSTGSATAGAEQEEGRPGRRRLPPSLTLVGRNWHAVTEGRKAGHGPTRGDRSAIRGELMDSGGNRIGEFYGSSACVDSPSDAAWTNVETHTFQLRDGTIHGMGTTTPGHDAEAVFAVVGGTGRYHGARGSYAARQSPVEHGGDGSAGFRVTFTR
jgi:hypothetical protein